MADKACKKKLKEERKPQSYMSTYPLTRQKRFHIKALQEIRSGAPVNRLCFVQKNKE